MRMIFRADDVGYTDVNDIGAFETMERGVVSAADVMLDTPGTVGALTRLREMPWISVGWHTHFWGSPVLDPGLVPSLIISGTGRFRHDLRTAQDFSYDELLAEMRAQIDRCLSILGRVPDTGGSGLSFDAPFAKAVGQICSEYGIPVNFAYKTGRDGMAPPDDRWADSKIYIMDPDPAYRAATTDTLELFQNYDPVRYYTDDLFGIGSFPADAVLEQSWHPGYLDHYNMRDGDYGPRAAHFTLLRIIDVHALCSGELHNWIRENGIELCNFRDALYGTRSYQNHLRMTGNDLYLPPS